MDDFGQYKDLPDEIPAILVLGTQVTGMVPLSQLFTEEVGEPQNSPLPL